MNFVTERETEIAKEHLKNGKKSSALLALKKRTYQQGLLDQTHTQLFNLDQLLQTIEFAQVEAKVFEGLKTGNLILKELQEETKIEDVEKLMDDTAEAIQYQNVTINFIFMFIFICFYLFQELSQLIAGNQYVHIDEDELLEELEELKNKEVLGDGIIKVGEDIIKLPSVPDHEIIIKRKDHVLDLEPEHEHEDEVEGENVKEERILIPS